MSIELNGIRYTEFNDLYNRPDFLSPDEKAKIELEIERMGELIESRKNKCIYGNLYIKVQKLMPKDNREITQEILKEIKDVEDFIVATDEVRFLNDSMLQKQFFSPFGGLRNCPNCIAPIFCLRYPR